MYLEIIVTEREEIKYKGDMSKKYRTQFEGAAASQIWDICTLK